MTIMLNLPVGGTPVCANGGGGDEDHGGEFYYWATAGSATALAAMGLASLAIRKLGKMVLRRWVRGAARGEGMCSFSGTQKYR